MHSTNDLVMFFGDFSGHLGWNIGRFAGVHGGDCVGQRNLEGQISLVLPGKNEFYTWFKREEKRKVTFRLGGNEAKNDFLRKEDRCFLQNV